MKLYIFTLAVLAPFLEAYYYKLAGGFKKDLFITCYPLNGKCLGSDEGSASIFKERFLDGNYAQIMLVDGQGEELCLEQSSRRKELRLAKCADRNHLSDNQMFMFERLVMLTCKLQTSLWWDGHGRAPYFTYEPVVGNIFYTFMWQAKWYRKSVDLIPPSSPHDESTRMPIIIDWQRSDDSWWAHGCDFRSTRPEDDFFSDKLDPGQCGPRCANIFSCTHYSWSKDSGKCWFKRGQVLRSDAIALSNRDILCGIVHPEKRRRK